MFEVEGENSGVAEPTSTTEIEEAVEKEADTAGFVIDAIVNVLVFAQDMERRGISIVRMKSVPVSVEDADLQEELLGDDDEFIADQLRKWLSGPGAESSLAMDLTSFGDAGDSGVLAVKVTIVLDTGLDVRTAVTVSGPTWLTPSAGLSALLPELGIDTTPEPVEEVLAYLEYELSNFSAPGEAPESLADYQCLVCNGYVASMQEALEDADEEDAEDDLAEEEAYAR